jgi:hypothetical protein
VTPEELAAEFKTNRKHLPYLEQVRCPHCRGGMVAAVVWYQDEKYLWIVGGRNAHTAARLDRSDAAAAGGLQAVEAARRSLSNIEDVVGSLPPDHPVVAATDQWAEYAERVAVPEPPEMPGVADRLPEGSNEFLTFEAVPCPKCRRPSRLVAGHSGVIAVN